MATISSLTVNDTGSLTLPNGTVANRTSNTATVVSFTSTGSTTWTCPAGVTSVEVLVVAGGGGGGFDVGGGGGAGGLLYNSAYPVNPAQVYTVLVGSGGVGSTSGTTQSTAGTNSQFDTLIAIGGGFGGNWSTNVAYKNGGSGGSGGGGGGWQNITVGGAGTYGQGYAGGNNNGNASYWSGGSGGGAGGPGTNSVYDSNIILSAQPGPGLTFGISGILTTYARGGWGGNDGSYPQFVATQPANSGNGGDGQGGTNSNGNGGTGVVILRYIISAGNVPAASQTRFNTVTKATEYLNSTGNWVVPVTGDNANIVSNGLILNIDAARYSSSSTTWNDLSPAGNHITLSGTPSYNANYGGYLIFNGSTAYGGNASTNGLISNPSYTMTTWIQFNNLSLGAGNDAGIIWYGGNAASAAAALDQKGNQLCSLHYGDDLTFTSFTPVTGVWYHIGLTYNSGTKQATLFVNGAQVQTVTHTTNLAIVTNKIGIGNDTALTRAWPGLMGAAQVYNRVLSITEIQQNYNSQASRFVTTYRPVKPATVDSATALLNNGILMLLDAGDPTSYPGTGTTWYDLANKANGTLVNGPVYSPDGGGSIQFTGSSSTKVTFPNVYLGPSNAYSVNVWFKTSSASAYQDIFDLDDTTGGIWIVTSGGLIQATMANGSGIMTATYSINTWYNLTLVGAQNYARLYINGILAGSSLTGPVTPSITNGLPLSVARIANVDGDRASEYLTGNVAYLAVYGRALTYQEVKQNFEALRGRFGV